MDDPISPESAVSLSGNTLARHGNRAATRCGCCGSTAIIIGPSITCLSDSCEWGVGSGMDFLALKMGGYRQAVEAAAEYLPYYSRKGEGEIRELKARRTFLDFLRSVNRKTQQPDIERLLIRQEFMEAASIPNHTTEGLQLFLTQEESRTLLLHLAIMGVDVPPALHDRASTVSVFWENFHTPSVLHVTPRNARSGHTVQLRKSRFAWYGLHRAKVDTAGTDIFPEVSDVLQVLDVRQLEKPDRLVTTVHCVPTHRANAIELVDPVFHVPNNAWTSRIQGWSHIPFFEQAGFMVDGTRMTFKELMKHLWRYVPPENFKMMCSASKFSEEARAWMMEWLVREPDTATVREIQHILSRVLLDRDESLSIYKTVSGYEAVKRNKPDKEPISNFTIDIKDVTGFTMMSDVEYGCVARIGNQEVECTIMGRSFDVPSAVAGAVASAQIVSPSHDTKNNLAQVVESSLMKKVLALVRSSAGSLPRYRGFRNLGWTHRQDVYVFPQASAGASGISGDARYKAVHDSDFHCFTFGIEAPSILEPPACPVIAELISAFVGQQIRSFLGLPYRLVPVANSERNRRVLGQLFGAMGQTAPLRLSSLLQRNLDTARGYPCLVVNLNDSQAERVTLAGARLAEKGRETSDVSNEQAAEAGRLLRYILEQIALSLLKGEETGFKSRRSVKLANAQALEGADVLRKLFGSWPEAGAAWAAVDTVLEKSERRLVDQARIRRSDDIVILYPPLWEDLSVMRDDLVIELGQLCHMVKVTEEGVEVDRNSIYPLFDEFYGSPPKLEMV